MALLSPQQAKRIAQTIGTVEKTTAGELVVMVLPRSDRYDGPRALITALWTVALAAGAILWAPWQLDPLWIAFAQLPLAAAIWMLLGWAPLLRLVLPRSRVHTAVHARALQAFVERGVHQTRDRSGLLIFLSELEQRVEIIGDSGIHERIGDEGWAARVSHIVTAIRTNRAADGIIEVIEALGQVLAEHFPPRPDDRNELPNTVLQE